MPNPTMVHTEAGHGARPLSDDIDFLVGHNGATYGFTSTNGYLPNLGAAVSI